MKKTKEDIELQEAIGERIKTLRVKKGWDQWELAEKLGCERPRMCRLEKGIYMPTVKEFYKLTKILDVSFFYLYANEKEETWMDEELKQKYKALSVKGKREFRKCVRDSMDYVISME